MARTYTNNQFPKFKTDLVNDRGGYDLNKIDNAFIESSIWETLAQTEEDKKQKIAETLVKNKEYNFSKVKDREKKYMDDAKKVNQRLQRQYQQAIKETQDDIMNIYDKITKDLGYLNTNNLSEKEQLELAKKINLNSAKLMGLDANLKSMDNKVDTLHKSFNSTIGKHLKNVFSGAYNDSFKDAKKHIVKDKYKVDDLGKGMDAKAFQDRLVEESVRTSWGTKNLDFSDNVWKQQDKLKNDLRETITQGFIKGQSASEMSEKIAERYNVSHSRAKCLVQTETNRVFNQAQTKSLLDQGYEEGEIQSMSDNRTSSTCSKLDGTVIKLKDAMPGVNAPPFHPNCRSILVPKIQGQGVLKRWSSKDEDTYKWDDLPSDMQQDILKGKSLKQAVGFDAPNIKVPKDTFDKLPKAQQDILKRNGLIDFPKGKINNPKIDNPKVGVPKVDNPIGEKTVGKQKDGTYYFGDKPLKFEDKEYKVDNRLGFNDTKQAIHYLQDEFNIAHIDLDDIAEEGIISIANKVDELTNKYPNMKGKISEIICEDYQGSLGWCQLSQRITNSDGSDGYRSRISACKRWYSPKKIEEFAKVCEKDARQRWHPKGTTWEDTFIHEFGHALHNDLFGVNVDAELNKIRKKVVMKITDKKYSEVDADFVKGYIRHELSEYGAKNSKETFAEAFSDYITNGDNATEFAKEFMNSINEVKKGYIRNSNDKKLAQANFKLPNLKEKFIKPKVNIKDTDKVDKFKDTIFKRTSTNKPNFGDKPMKFKSDVDNHLGFNDTSQAIKHMTDNLGLEFVDLEDLADEVVISVANKFDELIDRFPHLKGTIDEISSVNLDTDINASCLAFDIVEKDGKKRVLSRIELNNANFSNVKKLIKNHSYNVEDGWSPKGTTWEDVLIHEVGHSLSYDLYGEVVDNNINLTNLNSLYKKVFGKINGVNPEDISEEYIYNYAKKNISEYASSHEAELFSECFAEFMANGENSNEFTKELMKFVKEDIDKIHG